MLKRVAVLTCLVVAALLCVFVFPAEEAEAQSSATEAEEVYRFRQWLEKAKPADFASQAEATRRQQALTTASRTTVGNSYIKPALLVRGALVTVAVGLTIHNGVTFYNAVQCGQTACPTPINLDATFGHAQETQETINGKLYAKGSTKAYDSAGRTVGGATITNMTYTLAGGYCTATVNFSAHAAPDMSYTKGVADFGLAYRSGTTSLGGCNFTSGAKVVPDATFPASPRTYTSQQTCRGTPEQSMRSQFWIRDIGSNDGTQSVTRWVGPEVVCGYGHNWENPVYDWGQSEVVESAPVVDGRQPIVIGGADSGNLYDALKQRECVDSPPAGVTPELCDAYDPYDWTTEPDGDPDFDSVTNYRDIDPARDLPADPSVSVAPDGPSGDMHPWDDPRRHFEPDPWYEIEPDGENDEVFFGPKVDEYQLPDGDWVTTFHDHTIRITSDEYTAYLNYPSSDMYNHPPHRRAIWHHHPTDGNPPYYSYWSNGYIFRQGSNAGGCLVDGEAYVYRSHRYGDGAMRELFYELETGIEESNTRQPVCDEWRQNGALINAPADLSPYMFPALTDPEGML